MICLFPSPPRPPYQKVSLSTPFPCLVEPGPLFISLVERPPLRHDLSSRWICRTPLGLTAKIYRSDLCLAQCAPLTNCLRPPEPRSQFPVRSFRSSSFSILIHHRGFFLLNIQVCFAPSVDCDATFYRIPCMIFCSSRQTPIRWLPHLTLQLPFSH